MTTYTLFHAGDIVEAKEIRKALGNQFGWAQAGGFIEFHGRLWLKQRWTPFWKVKRDIVKPA